MAGPESILIVGAGECGARVASALRDEGYDQAITLIGAETHFPYERPPLSKTALTQHDDPRPVTVTTPEGLADRGIEFRSGQRVDRVDRQERTVVLADEVRLPYDRLVLSTGARARTLPVPGGDHALTLRTFDDSIVLRADLQPGRHVAIIGAGFIGLEVAASARERGCEVTVLEIASRALGRAVPPALADVIVDRHRTEGVEIRCDVATTAISSVGDGFVVETSVGPIPADVVVAGIGATPNVELAEAAGLAVDNGIVVDEHLRTSGRDIFAAGDCCSAWNPLFGQRIRLESWRNAYDQAVVVAANLLGGNVEYRAVPWFWSDQYDLGLQVAGLPHLAVETVVRTRDHNESILFGLDGTGRLVSAAAVGTGTTMARDIRVAEMMIADERRPDPTALADPDTTLKALLRST